MNKKILLLLSIAAVFISLQFGCAKKPSDETRILAKVSSKAITLKDFNARIAKLPEYYKSAAAQNKKRFLDDMIVERLFYEEAVRKGVDRDKEIQDIVNEAKRKIVITKFIKNK